MAHPTNVESREGVGATGRRAEFTTSGGGPLSLHLRPSPATHLSGVLPELHPEKLLPMLRPTVIIIEFCSLLGTYNVVARQLRDRKDSTLSLHTILNAEFRDYYEVAQWYSDAFPSAQDDADVSPQLVACLN